MWGVQCRLHNEKTSVQKHSVEVVFHVNRKFGASACAYSGS